MMMDIQVGFVIDENNGYGAWLETPLSLRKRIAETFGFKESLVVVDDDGVYYDGSVAYEANFRVMSTRFNVRFDYDKPENTFLSVL